MTADLRLTFAERAAVAALAACVVPILAAYLLDLAGLAFTPARLLAVLIVAAALAFLSFRDAASSRADGVMLAGVIILSAAWLLWLARPTLLPLSTGPDLTHHLLLIRYIEQHWRLVHEPGMERFLGEMAQYTPGSHILAALGGAWSGTDGLRALHPMQALTVALKCGFLFLIGLRLLPPRAPRALAVTGVVLLLAAPRYALGGLTEYGFVAQVVAELFVIAMWWAAVAWDARPDARLGLVFGLAGAAAFLTWPVYTGPPALAFFLVIALRRDVPLAARLGHLLAAYVPLAAFALIYLVGRLGWLQLAGTGGAAPWPSVAEYSTPLVGLASAGLVLALVRRRGRATALFLVCVLVQAAAFYVLATRAGAPQPYMALKMGYLLLWPMAACAVMGLGEVWPLLERLRGDARPRLSAAAAAVVVIVAVLVVARPLMKTPARLHPLPPAVSLPLYDAGRWARAALPAGCIEYLVGDDETAYWLHLAVLGNPRMSDRTGNNATYEPNDAVMRWLTPNGLPYAIADLPALPKDVREELDVIQPFGTAAVVRRRGASACDAPQ